MEPEESGSDEEDEDEEEEEVNELSEEALKYMQAIEREAIPSIDFSKEGEEILLRQIHKTPNLTAEELTAQLQRSGTSPKHEYWRKKRHLVPHTAAWDYFYNWDLARTRRLLQRLMDEGDVVVDSQGTYRCTFDRGKTDEVLTKTVLDAVLEAARQWNPAQFRAIIDRVLKPLSGDERAIFLRELSSALDASEEWLDFYLEADLEKRRAFTEMVTALIEYEEQRSTSPSSSHMEEGGSVFGSPKPKKER